MCWRMMGGERKPDPKPTYNNVQSEHWLILIILLHCLVSLLKLIAFRESIQVDSRKFVYKVFDYIRYTHMFML